MHNMLQSARQKKSGNCVLWEGVQDSDSGPLTHTLGLSNRQLGWHP